jgi:hypothetical protein
MLAKKLLILTFPIFLFVLLNLIFIDNINQSLIYPNRFKYDVFPDANERFDYVVIGHSHGRDSFNFQLNENNGINLSFSSQNLYWSKELITHYEQYFLDTTTIIIEVSFNTFCQKESFGNIRYVNLGFDRTQVGISITDYIVSKYVPLLGINGFNILLNPTNHFANRDLDFDTPEALETNSQEFLENLSDSEICSEEVQIYNIDLLNELIAEQQKNNRTVILFSAPIYGSVSSNNNFEKTERVVLTYELIKYFSDKYNLRYLDFYNHPEISSNPDYFRNANHLNDLGAKEFMKLFFNDLYSE